MTIINKEIFVFSSDALSNEKFFIAHFEGTESLNALFHFEILLLCRNANIDTEAMVGTRAVFTIQREKGKDAVFPGYISKIEKGGCFNGYSYYTVNLEPAFGKIKNIVSSRIFLDKDLQKTIERIIDPKVCSGLNYEFRFSDKYPKKEFAMQYNENTFEYILWRLEQEGAYFYFDADGERVIFADNPMSHDPVRGTVYYSPTTGFEHTVVDEVIQSFELHQTFLPARVIVRNYDWKNPKKILVGIEEVSKIGLGDVYLTNEKTETEEEAKRIARIRAEQILSTRRIFKGSGSVPFLRPGVVFSLTKHYSKKFNKDYLVTKIRHEGRQETLLNLVLGIPIKCEEDHLFYRNTFECIESNVKYRPSRTVERSRIPGAIRAFIDGDGSGKPLMDKYGRYKVWFPFDISGISDGKASCWIRRAQEQVGKDFGIASPLNPGIEVLITFINGDPDQPIINRALPNGETGSISGPGNKSLSGLKAEGGAQVTFDNVHGVMQFSNATGSEIMFGSGSADYMRENTHNALKSTAIGGAEISGGTADYISGFVNRRRAVCYNEMNYICGLVAAAAKPGQYIYDSLSNRSADPNEPSPDFSGLATKLIPLTAFVKAPPYNVRLTASKENVSSRLQCFPDKSSFIATITAMLLSRIGSAATDTADNAKVQKSNGYDASVKKSVKRNKIIGQAAGLLPELGALIALIYMKGNLEKKAIGGIMIDARDKNINLHAKTYIGNHADGGIYLNTISAQYDHKTEEKDEIGSWGSPTIKSYGLGKFNQVIMVFKPIFEMPVMMVNTSKKDISSKLQCFPNESLLPKKRDLTFGEILKEGHTNKRKGAGSYAWGSGVSNPLKPQNKLSSFIALKTHLYYMKSTYSYQYARYEWKSLAPNLEFSTKVNDEDFVTFFEIKKDKIEAESKERIVISCLNSKNDQNKKSKFVSLSMDSTYFGCVVTKGTAEHSFTMTQDYIALYHTKKSNNTRSSLMMNNGSLFLSTGLGINQAQLLLSDEVAHLDGKEVFFGRDVYVFNKKGITSSKKGKIKLGRAGELVIHSLKKVEYKIDADIQKKFKKDILKVEPVLSLEAIVKKKVIIEDIIDTTTKKKKGKEVDLSEFLYDDDITFDKIYDKK